jgi:hypothetical protein
VLEPPNDLGGEEVLFWSPFSDRRQFVERAKEG